jgi:hypothetical protein
MQHPEALANIICDAKAEGCYEIRPKCRTTSMRSQVRAFYAVDIWS